MAASLLSTLGLSMPRRGLPGQAPTGRGQPTGPIRAPGVTPREELPAPRPPAEGRRSGTSGEPTDAEIAAAKAAFEKTRLKGAEQLAAVVARIGAKQRRDPLVAVLRNGLARIQPFVSDEKFRKGLHAALDELASKGLEKGFVKLIELALGKTAGEVKRPDTGVPPTGTKPDKAPGEVIVTKDIPIGDAKGNARFVFDGAPARVAPGQPMLFKVWTPARWRLSDKRWDNTRVIVEARGNGPKGATLPSAAFRRKGANEVKLKAPDVAGTYVLYIEAAGMREPSPEHEFSVAP